jgi:HK97 family phage portal protein
MSIWNLFAPPAPTSPLQAAIVQEREARGATVGTDETDARLLGALGFGGFGSVGGVTVNERSALSFAAVWACVLAISQDIAALPCQLFQDTPTGGKEKVLGHAATRLLNLQASPLQNALPHRQAMIATVLLHGNAYARIDYTNRYQPTALYYKHPNQTEVIQSGGKLYYRFWGDPVIRQDYEVIHLRGLCLDSDGVMGMSVLRAHRENIGQGLAAQRVGSRFYDNGAKVSGALETDALMKPEVAERLRDNFSSIYGGADNAGKVVVLEQGLKFKSISLPPADAQFLETRKFTRGEIASIFRVPPHKIGDLERSTNNNIEQQSIDYVQNTLQPWLVNIEQEYRLKLLSTREVDTCYFRHNLAALMRADATARGTYYRTMTDIGVYSINDVRALEEMNGIGEEGDARFVQVNRQTLANALTPPVPAVAPVPDPTPAP